MDKQKANPLIRAAEKLFGGLNMSWLTVILFAVGTAVLTAIFLVAPVFRDTSFYRMGVTFEAWIFFAVIIMANCEKPLESALKTFVFFLVSQPLIYLLQVPFSPMGWKLFGYYRYWFYLTLATFPMAFIGWYLKKKNWWSLLILSSVLVELSFVLVEGIKASIGRFPHLLVTALFCLLQIGLYILAFCSSVKQKLIGILIPLITVIALLALTAQQVNLTVVEPLPDRPSFSEEAILRVEDGTVANIQLNDPVEGEVYIHAFKHGSTGVTITDGDQEYRYTVEIYADQGVEQTRITPAG